MKKQFMAMLDEIILDRIDALRIVMGVSRAEVVRQALDGSGLAPMEAMHTDRLARLFRLSDRYGQDWRTFVRQVVAGQKVMPTLEVMEIEEGMSRRPKGRTRVPAA